ncbi:protein of unknown function [Petrocella atlantisensis]|uniref:Uncharacterized protein n=1 Tax=Petrocella atlantisensis TaxID=2173034 RepID=A0A3P7PQN8_9FIRM|nr:protein of unknown function [Petrocella atlantisensis]
MLKISTIKSTPANEINIVTNLDMLRLLLLQNNLSNSVLKINSAKLSLIAKLNNAITPPTAPYSLTAFNNSIINLQYISLMSVNVLY